MSLADFPSRLVTADELPRISAELSMQGQRCELVNGELVVMALPGGEHGSLAGELAGHLWYHLRRSGQGQYFVETGFLIARDPDTVRSPDVAFVKASVAKTLGSQPSYYPVPPTLAVEVVSPNDRASEVNEKARAWIEAGSEQVWIVFPSDRSVTVYRSLDDIRVLTNDAVLVGGDVLPGFELPLPELFRCLDS